MRIVSDTLRRRCPTCTAFVPVVVELDYHGPKLVPTAQQHPLYCPACRVALAAVWVTARGKKVG